MTHGPITSRPFEPTAFASPAQVRRGERTARLPAFHIGEWWRLAPIDLLVIGAKTFDNPWIAPLLAPQLTHGATVISAQNGVNEPLLADLLGSERVIGAVVLFPAGSHRTGSGAGGLEPDAANRRDGRRSHCSAGSGWPRLWS